MRAMKRNISLVLVMAILFTGFAGLAEESGVPIDVEHFPDAAFRSFIREQDEDKNDYLDQPRAGRRIRKRIISKK